MTQARSLARAEQQVRDYLETLLDVDVSAADIEVTPDLGSVQKQIEEARRERRAAELAQRRAAEKTRTVVVALRKSGLSVYETARIMGVTPGRVSQIAKKAAARGQDPADVRRRGAAANATSRRAKAAAPRTATTR